MLNMVKSGRYSGLGRFVNRSYGLNNLFKDSVKKLQRKFASIKVGIMVESWSDWAFGK